MKWIVFAQLLFLMMNHLTVIKGTTCRRCIGRNAAACRVYGKLVECNVGEVCATTVRRNAGMIISVSKRCKQREACLNEQKQNWMKINAESFKCNNNRRQSTCRCCCFDDRCNENGGCAALDRRQVGIRCPALDEPFRYGTRRCSKGNRIGSVCRVRCSSSYEVNPSFSERITCLPNGKWDKPVPCCSKPCPPNLFIDMVLVKHFRDHRLVQSTIEQQLADMLRVLTVGPKSLRFAMFHYDTEVHTPFIGFRESANLTSEELLNLSLDESDIDLDPSVANTGAALWYIYRNLFNTKYDRPDARNVVVLVTDKPSDDDVTAPARALRESGVTIYSYFFKTDGAQSPTDEEFLQISGFDDSQRIATPDRTAAHSGFFENLCPNTCKA